MGKKAILHLFEATNRLEDQVMAIKEKPQERN